LSVTISSNIALKPTIIALKSCKIIPSHVAEI